MYGLLSTGLGETFTRFVDNMKTVFSGEFRFTDAIDIVILSFLFYFVLR